MQRPMPYRDEAAARPPGSTCALSRAAVTPALRCPPVPTQEGLENNQHQRVPMNNPLSRLWVAARKRRRKGSQRQQTRRAKCSKRATTAIHVHTVDNGQRIFLSSHWLKVLVDPRDQLVLALHFLQNSLIRSCARLPQVAQACVREARGYSLLADCLKVKLRMALLALGCPRKRDARKRCQSCSTV